MRKIALSALLLAILTQFCVVAHADSVRSAAVLLGDTFYAMEGHALLRWRPETTPETVLTLPDDADPSLIDSLFTWRDGLWGIDRQTGALTQFDLEKQVALTPTLQLDWPDLYFENYLAYLTTGYEPVWDLFTLEDTLFLLHSVHYEEGHDPSYVILAFDLTAGTRRTYDIDDFAGIYRYSQCMAPYTTGKLLLASIPVYSDEPLTLHVLDIASGEAAELQQVEPNNGSFYYDDIAGGLAYDPATDTILLAYDHLLCRMQDGVVDIVGYIAHETNNRMPGFLLPDGRYVLDAGTDWDGANQSALTVLDWNAPIDLSNALRIAPDWWTYSACFSTYALARPGQLVLRADQTESDVLEIDFDELPTLASQGVLADLQHEPWIAEYLRSLPTSVRDRLTGPNGEVWGVPATLIAYTWSVDPAQWQAAGLPADPPTTWEEWIDLLIAWERDPDAHPGLVLLHEWRYDPLMEAVLEDYVQLYQAADGSVDFSRPVLHDALEKLSTLPSWDNNAPSLSEAERKRIGSLMNREELVYYEPYVYADGTWWMSLGPTVDPSKANRIVLLPPVFAKEEAPLARTSGSIWCVRADSPRLTQAIDCLRFYSEYISAPEFQQWSLATFPVSLDTLLDMGQAPPDLAALAYSVVEIPNNIYTAKDAPLNRYYAGEIDLDTLLATLQVNLDKALAAQE